MDATLVFGLIGLLGIGAQWIAWRTGWPAIALMLVAGVLAGPVFGILDPEHQFGELLEPIVAVAVAVILFDGGLNLNFRELRHGGPAVVRLTVLGVPTAWVLGSLAAHYLAGLVWPVAILFAGILVVTGPTVVGPLLRQLSLGHRPRTILKWEAIVNDPIGALLAVGIYEYYRLAERGSTLQDVGLWLLLASVFAVALGLALAFAIGWLFPRGYVPEYLKAPVVLVAVLLVFVASNAVADETGLLAVTVMGMALGNMRLSSLPEMRRFKENVTILLVSGVFIILSATLDLEALRRFEWRFVIFLAALLFLVRPASVLVSLMFSSVPWRERLFISWVAPRGIVATAISGLFALRLDELGYEDGLTLVTLSFAAVFATIFAHGFTAKPLARRLGLLTGETTAVLIVGASPWSLALGRMFRDLGVPVTIADPDGDRIAAARDAGLDAYEGEILSEVTQDHLALERFQLVVAATPNDAYNALIASDLGPELGHAAIFRLGNSVRAGHGSSEMHRGRALIPSGLGLDQLLARHFEGWTFETTVVDRPMSLAELRGRGGAEPILVHKKSGALRLFTGAKRPVLEPGDRVVTYGPPASPEPAADLGRDALAGPAPA